MQEIETKQTYEITSRGFIRHTHTEEWIGEETEMVKRLTMRAPIGVANVMSGKHMSVNQVGLALASRLLKLPLYTFFAPMTGTDEKVVMVPVFIQSNNRCAEMTMEWNVPETMRLYFLSRWVFPAGDAIIHSLVGIMPLFYLAAVDVTQQRVHSLPLPNVYEDGKICMGDSLGEFNLSKDIFTQHDFCFNAFLKSRWNADLLHDRSAQNSKRLFRFDSKGKPMPPEMAWTTLCPVVNHDAYSFLVKVP
jgi:hypothetical protein